MLEKIGVEGSVGRKLVKGAMNLVEFMANEGGVEGIG